MYRIALSFVTAALVAACAPTGAVGAPKAGKDTSIYALPAELEARVASGALQSTVLAGGCFWCFESAFEPLPGVVAVVSGYAGGPKPNPTYDQVGGGGTGHYEVIRVLYDPAKISYPTLLETFWRNVDPTQDDGQFCDRGPQYRAAIFAATPAERAAAEASKAAAEKTLGRPVVTAILPGAPFYAAEVYHQDFYKTNPEHYRAYREGCGRDRRLRALWGEAAGH